MHFAAAGGFASIIVVLLQAGGNINVTNSMRESPLHFACYHGKKDCVTYLLSKGADCNLVSNNGSPVQLARSRGFMDIVSILQQHGATVL